MPDYREMYYEMVRATEQAIRISIEVQQRCEEMAMEDVPPLLEYVKDE